MTVILFPVAAASPPKCAATTSADEQSSAAFIPSSSDAALSCSAFGRVGACGDVAPGASLDPSSSGDTLNRLQPVEGVSAHTLNGCVQPIASAPLDPLCNAPTAVSTGEPRFNLDVQKFNAALQSWDNDQSLLGDISQVNEQGI